MLHQKSKSIIQNIFSLTIGQIISTALSFLSITLAARFLGVENFGRFNYLLAIVFVVSRVIDLGLVPIVFRELSKNKSDFSLLNSALIIRIFAFIPTWILFNVTLIILDFTFTEILLANLLITNTFLSAKFVSFRELLDLPFKVSLKMHFPMLVNVIDNLILLILVILIPVYNFGLIYFVIAYLLANLPGFLIIIFLLKKKFRFKLKFEVRNISWLLTLSLPIYGYVILDVIYQQLDVLLLKYYFDYFEIGLYAAALRLVVPLLFFATAIIHTFFPIINENIVENISQNKKIVSFIFKMLFLFPTVLFLLFLFKSDDFVRIIFGNNYLGASTSTSILLLAQVFVFFNFFILNLTVVYNKQNWNFFLAAYLLLSNFLLNIVFIPMYHIEGAAFAKLLSALTASAGSFYFLKKLGHRVDFLSIGLLLWIALNGFILYLVSFLNFYAYLLLGILILLISFLYMGVLKRTEIDYLASLFKIEKWLLKFRIIRW
ncbi:MAG: oligosaccharide flippase family protein [Ignavibacteriaceae bacterium]|nr:oligosaccharide flippase family protein [Ignavibacteriaceae bacterium]